MPPQAETVSCTIPLPLARSRPTCTGRQQKAARRMPSGLPGSKSIRDETPLSPGVAILLKVAPALCSHERSAAEIHLSVPLQPLSPLQANSAPPLSVNFMYVPLWCSHSRATSLQLPSPGFLGDAVHGSILARAKGARSRPTDLESGQKTSRSEFCSVSKSLSNLCLSVPVPSTTRFTVKKATFPTGRQGCVGGSMSSWDEEMFTMMGGFAAFAVLCIAALLWLV